MARTVNLLPDGDALLRFSSDSGLAIPISSLNHQWIVLNNNANIEIIATDFVVDTRYTIRLNPKSASGIVLELPDIQLKAADNSRVLSANVKIKCQSSISVSALLYIDDNVSGVTPENLSGIAPNQQTFTSGQYSSVHTNRVVVPSDNEPHTASIRLTINGYTADGVSNNVFVTLPHLIHDFAFYENPFPGRMRNFLPDFYFEIDGAQESPTYPFFRLIDVLTAAAGETTLEHDRLYGVENSQVLTSETLSEFWTNSTLVSPRSVRPAYIPWLSQFTCGPLRQNIQLPNGTYYFDNQSLQRDFIERQLSTSYYGRAAGTHEAMVESIRNVLIKTKDGEPSTFAVAVTPRYLGDPFAINIKTITNETPDANEGETSAMVLECATWAKPMGYKISHITVDELFFSFDDPVFGVFDEFRFG